MEKETGKSTDKENKNKDAEEQKATPESVEVIEDEKTITKIIRDSSGTIRQRIGIVK